QAEDGIRDFHVTGVQTCALPISSFGGQRGALTTLRNGPPGYSTVGRSTLSRPPIAGCTDAAFGGQRGALTTLRNGPPGYSMVRRDRKSGGEGSGGDGGADGGTTS